MTNTFTTVFERAGDWWIGYVEELPGANIQSLPWMKRART